MEILIVVGLVGIAVFAFSGSHFSIGGMGYPGSPSPYQPRGVSSLAPGTNLNPLPSLQSTMIASGLQAGAAITQSAVAQSASGGNMSSTTAAGITAGIGAAVAIVGALLAAHKARLQGATNENNAATMLVPVYDSFIQQIVSMINTKQISKPQAAAAIASFDESLYIKMKSLVGAPGTSWNDAVGYAGTCNKSCTVSCCLYYGDLGPPLSLLRLLCGDPGGKWGRNDPRLSGRTVTVPKVYPGKYSSYSRNLYTVTLTA